MRVLRAVDDVRTALEPVRRAGRTIGLVPTMGALHDGHLSLIERARAECDVVVVSLFVNPAQFNESADLDRYPRREQRDRELAGAAGADLLFAPAAEEVYPAGFSTSVEVHRPDRSLGGGRTRSGPFSRCHDRRHEAFEHRLARHRLLRPEGRSAGDRDPTHGRGPEHGRAHRGLSHCARSRTGLRCPAAMRILNSEERARALAMPRALAAAAAAVTDGERSADALMAAAREAMSAFDVEPEYIELVQPGHARSCWTSSSSRRCSLSPPASAATRLIDNVTLDPFDDPIKPTQSREATIACSA